MESPAAVSDPVIVAKFDALVVENEKPTHASLDDIHTAFEPMMKTIADAQKQAIEYRRLINALAFSSPGAAVMAKIAMFRQVLGAMDTDLASWEALGYRVAGHFATLDRYLSDAQVDLGLADPVPVPVPTPVTTAVSSANAATP